MSSGKSPAIAPSPQASQQSSNAATPTPVLSKNALAPAGAGMPVTKIMTSKEWVLPPRPKPGRKPSADTPATKRKAQNRAAQRAFRERRATRVAELEAKLSEVEKEKEVNEMNLTNVVSKLQLENKFLLKALNDMKADYSSFKNTILESQHQHQHQHQHPPPHSIPASGPASAHASPSTAVFSNGAVSAPSPLTFFQPATSSTVPQQHKSLQPSPLPPSENLQQQQQQQQRHHQPISPALSNSKSPHDQQQSSATLTASGNSSSNSSSATATTTITATTNATSDEYDCGVCVKDDCICAEVGIKPQSVVKQEKHAPSKQEPMFENFKPMAPVSLKRKLNSDLEVDMTQKFAKTSASLKSTAKPMPKLKKSKQEPLKHSASTEDAREQNEFSTLMDKITDKDFESPMEQCGFCSDDSPCVCREAAKEAANAITELQNYSRREAIQPSRRNSTLPPIQYNTASNSKPSTINSAKLPVLHPGPTVEITEAHRSSISTPMDTTDIQDQPRPARESVSSGTPKGNGGGCTGNPGTCTQCQMDPMSTLFCTTIASKAEEQQEERKSPASPPMSNPSSKISSPMAVSSKEEELLSLQKDGDFISPASSTTSTFHQKGMFIPCADAYKTLSRHKNFNSVDFSTLVGKLTTRGMQVEVQSVANVLRELDRRLYS